MVHADSRYTLRALGRAESVCPKRLAAEVRAGRLVASRPEGGRWYRIRGSDYHDWRVHQRVEPESVRIAARVEQRVRERIRHEQALTRP